MTAHGAEQAWAPRAHSASASPERPAFAPDNILCITLLVKACLRCRQAFYSCMCRPGACCGRTHGQRRMRHCMHTLAAHCSSVRPRASHLPHHRAFSMQTSPGGTISAVHFWQSLPVASKLLIWLALGECGLWVANLAVNAAVVSAQPPAHAAGVATCSRSALLHAGSQQQLHKRCASMRAPSRASHSIATSLHPIPLHPIPPHNITVCRAAAGRAVAAAARQSTGSCSSPRLQRSCASPGLPWMLCWARTAGSWWPAQCWQCSTRRCGLRSRWVGCVCLGGWVVNGWEGWQLTQLCFTWLALYAVWGVNSGKLVASTVLAAL